MRLLAAIMATYAAMALAAPILFGIVLATPLEPLVGLFRPIDEQRQTMVWAYLAQFTRAFLFAAMIVSLHGLGPLPVRKGAGFGLLAGLFIGTFHAANTASLPLPAMTGVAWVAFDTILLTLGGTVFAIAYRPRVDVD